MQLGAASPCQQVRRLSTRPLHCSEAVMAPYLDPVYGRSCQRGSRPVQQARHPSKSIAQNARPRSQCAAVLGTKAPTSLGIKEATAAEVQARVADHTTNKVSSTKPQLIVMFTATCSSALSLVELGWLEQTLKYSRVFTAWHTPLRVRSHVMALLKCGPCSLVLRELQKLVALRPRGSLDVLVVDVDQDANKDFASQLGIASLPTLVFVGEDRSKRSISTVGHVSSRLIADVLDTKMSICGADLGQRLRLS